MKSSHRNLEQTIFAALMVVAIAVPWASPLDGQTPPLPGHFIDATEQLGIRCRQRASPTLKKYLLETMDCCDPNPLFCSGAIPIL
jgi:hypothetical protein